MMSSYMNDNEFADLFNKEVYTVWVGDAGYDTRPYLRAETRRNRNVLPVSYQESFADGRGENNVSQGNINYFLNMQALGSVVVVPNYSGMNYEGEIRYMKFPDGWKEANCL